MGNRLCPKCGQEYSDTYRNCPFCEEEEAEKKGKPLRRRGGKRLSKRKRSAGAGGIMLLVVAVVVIGVAGYVFFGEEIASFMGIRTEQTLPDDGEANVTPPDGEGSGETDDTGEDAQSPADGEQTGGPLALDQSTITIPSGNTALLTATGGTGEVTWSSSNDNIATVDGGSVTGKAGGTVTITATSGEESVTCTVTVTGDPWVSDAKLSLNKTDFTLRSGNPDVQMKVEGTDSPVTWASENPSVATISESGVVRWAGKGTTNITATVDGQVLTCIVRCR